MTDQTKLVSIIMHIYNRERLILPTLETILNQTYSNFELIIIDDGSTDDTVLVLNCIKDDRIVIIPMPHTGNLSEMKNIGLERAKGEYICFMDSDDLWLLNKVEKQCQILENNNLIGYTFCNAQYFREDKIYNSNFQRKMISAGFANRGTHLFQQILDLKLIILAPSIMFRKVCIANIGTLDTSFKTGFEYMVRLAYHYEGYLDSTSFLKVRRHQDNISISNGLSDFDEIPRIFEIYKETNRITNTQFKHLCLNIYLRKGYFARKRCAFDIAIVAYRKSLSYSNNKIRTRLLIFYCQTLKIYYILFPKTTTTTRTGRQ